MKPQNYVKYMNISKKCGIKKYVQYKVNKKRKMHIVCERCKMQKIS